MNGWFTYFEGSPDWFKMLLLITITVFSITLATLLFNAVVLLIK